MSITTTVVSDLAGKSTRFLSPTPPWCVVVCGDGVFTVEGWFDHGGRRGPTCERRCVLAPQRSGERTRPRVQFSGVSPESLFGGTPNTTRGDAYAPQSVAPVTSQEGKAPSFHTASPGNPACPLAQRSRTMRACQRNKRHCASRAEPTLGSEIIRSRLCKESSKSRRHLV